MGVDVVEIGLRHRLPVHNRKKLAKELATMLDINVKIVAHKEFVYDESTHTILDFHDYEEIPLVVYKFKEEDNYLRVICSNYQKKHIRDMLGDAKVRTLRYESPDTKADFFYEDYTLYEAESIEMRNGDHIHFDIYKENVVLSHYVCSRWHNFISEFKDPDCIGFLKETRKEVYKEAKMFGCDCVIYCSDGTPSSRIWDDARLKSSELLEYAQSGKFLDPNDGINWGKKYDKARIINFADFMDGKVKFEDGEFVEAIIDDFRGLE